MMVHKREDGGRFFLQSQSTNETSALRMKIYITDFSLRKAQVKYLVRFNGQSTLYKVQFSSCFFPKQTNFLSMVHVHKPFGICRLLSVKPFSSPFLCKSAQPSTQPYPSNGHMHHYISYFCVIIRNTCAHHNATRK